MNGAITRRAILANVCGAMAMAQVTDPLRTLRAGHARLIALDGDLERVRVLIREGGPARKVYQDLVKDAERVIEAAPVEYAPRLLAVSQRVLDRMYLLCLLYRLDRKSVYLERAVQELRAAAAFKDWNPGHLPDAAEMTHAFAIAYDWLYAGLSITERMWIRDAIVKKGLDPALAAYQAGAPWTRGGTYWNPVCNGGFAMGALAVAEDEAEKSAAVLRRAADSIGRGFSGYSAEGAWMDGPSTWDLATRYFVYFSAGLETALGNDLGVVLPGSFTRTARYRLYFGSPSASRQFGYADSREELTTNPAMFWLSRHLGQPVYAWQEQKVVERGGRAEPLDLVWYPRESKPPVVTAFPLDAIFPSVQLASMRSSWDDPNALALAVKGGDNRGNRAHADLGSFVLDAGGVRWAREVQVEDAPLSDVGLRPKGPEYRLRTESHNMLTIDNESQDPRAEARITRHEFGPDLSWVQIDLSKAYPAKVKAMQRRIGLANRAAVLIEDTMQSDQPVEVLWGMITGADISTEGPNAELTKDGWSLSAEIRTPRHAVWDVVPTRSPALKKLVVRVGGKVKDLDLNIVLTPHRTGQPKPKVTARFPA